MKKKSKTAIGEQAYNDLVKELQDSQTDAKAILGTVTNGGTLVSAATGVGYAAQVLNGALYGDKTKNNPGLVAVSGELGKGISEATDENGKLSVGLNKLVTGSSKLAAGEAQLSDGASELAAGMNELYSKSGLLISGIGQLDAGS